MIKTVLWDVDGTLLDFNAAERAAIKTLFEEFGLGECTDEMIARYSEINVEFWQRLERNELTKAEALVARFERFFGEYGFDTSMAAEFNERYQLTLGDTIVYRDDSLNVVKSLKGKVRQYVVSNGTVAAQTKKLERSKLGELMDGVFLSEELGVEKPNPGFFEKVFAAIGAEDPSEIMIVGDSLTSDIRGGMNAGIATCWYDPENKPVPEGFRVDHTISDLHELEGLLDPALHKLHFKEGCGWKACYDETAGTYTAERGGIGAYHLYEITEEIFELLEDGMDDRETYKIIGEGRHLYMDVNDRCGPPYTVVFDDDYEKLCPWANIISSGKVWPDVLTDAAVELFASEKNNREQRRRRREAREAQEKKAPEKEP